MLGRLPNPQLTGDQVKLLRTDNVVSDAAIRDGRTFTGLGMHPQAPVAILESYLWHYRPAGQFSRRTLA